MKKVWKKVVVGMLVVLLVCSVAVNFFLFSKMSSNREVWNVNVPDSNSRDNYFTIHNLKEAQKVSKGEGIKVGILDWGFGFLEHDGLYAGGSDFSTWKYHDDNFNHTNEHGFWMAQTLKEIAPEAEVYALGTFNPDSEDEWVDSMIEAIGWAQEQKLDILTLSHQAISEKNRGRFDEAVNKAVANGMVTTFIHYDNPNNILPWGIWSDNGGYKRLPDINIFQYDYNTVFLNNYASIMNDADFNAKYKSELYLSVSSMSVVTAGFVAILKGIDNTLTPAQYKEILINTSHPMEYEGDKAEHVVDIGAAVNAMF